MKLPEIKRLAGEHDTKTLEQAAQSFETKLENKLNVQGSDDGDILTNLLMAIEVKKKMDQGMDLNEAIREISSRVRGVLS